MKSELGLQAWFCTYRFQINAEFDFEDLAEVAGYLAALGVSHAYLSPILRAARGSTHGYDIADATQINPEWGGEEVYAKAAEALASNGIGQLLDIVPNHMSISTPANAWWWDVLERGPNSAYLHYFDFGWKRESANFQPLKLPVLEDRYIRVLDAGKITLARTGNDFRVQYGSWAFPVATASYPWIIGRVARLANEKSLAKLADAFARMPMLRHELWRSLEEHFEKEEAVRIFDDALGRLNLDAGLIHELLDQQFYRLAYWRTANQSWLYRRFFDVNTLAGLRIEQDDVFTVRHRRELRLARSGVVDGLRIDHIDGLRYPARYLQALRTELPEHGLWVEKILAKDEQLRLSWPVQGTTGYEYLNHLNGLFIDPHGEAEMTRIYAEFTGEQRSFGEVLNQAKREVIRDLFGGELADLVDLFSLSSEQLPQGRDWSRRDIEAALLEYIVALPVYRTYVESGVTLPGDQLELIARVIAEASSRHPDIERELFDFLQSLMTMNIEGDHAAEFVLRCQQLTGPAMAKGAEDTAFYRYGRLLSLNEVGGAPDRFGVSLEEWHVFCGRISHDWPLSLIATSTHDTKRGEDARQRLNVLSEMPELWRRTLSELAEVLSQNQDVPPLDRSTQYIFFQTVVASWPLDAGRAVEYMRKAVREAKRETSWTMPNAEYERLLETYIETALANPTFTEKVDGFVRRVDGAAIRNSLSQTVLKLTAPGVPDIYRGCEVFSYSLVDPDNRRPIDLKRLRALLDEAAGTEYDQSWEATDPDLAKIWLVNRTLSLRREHAASFGDVDSYTPLKAEGPGANRVVAFLRGDDVCVVAARWFARESAGLDATELDLPDGVWRNCYTSRDLQGRISVDDVLNGLSAGLLEKKR